MRLNIFISFSTSLSLIFYVDIYLSYIIKAQFCGSPLIVARNFFSSKWEKIENQTSGKLISYLINKTRWRNILRLFHVQHPLMYLFCLLLFLLLYLFTICYTSIKQPNISMPSSNQTLIILDGQLSDSIETANCIIPI